MTERILSSFYADDSSYAVSDHLHRANKTFVTDLLQPILLKLEIFCSKWRIGLNPTKTWCMNFHLTKENNNTPHLYLQGEILKYQKSFKFLGVTFDQQLSFKDHINDITTRCRKRLNLQKAIRGQEWGASAKTILYTYKTFIRPVLEYCCILFAHASEDLLTKIQAIEIEAIKIAYRFPPWTTNTWCYKTTNIENVLQRLKTQAKKFLSKNKSCELIKTLIEDAKPSLTGHHSPVFKTLNS